MTVGEVSRILGAPPGDHTVFKKPYVVGWAVAPSHRVPGGVATRSTSMQWNGDAGTILLRLKDGKVTLRLFCGHKEGDTLSPDEEDWSPVRAGSKWRHLTSVRARHFPARATRRAAQRVARDGIPEKPEP
jgi:hypothetical protein